MARRSIAKTAIEGGRRKSCRIREEQEDSKERAAYKMYCRSATYDEEAVEPRSIALGGHWTGRKNRDFADKLGPLRRWLEARVGKPWDKIKSEVISRFDSNSLAGRHALGHLEGFVTLPNAPYSWMRRKSAPYPGSLFVDSKGILQQAPKTAEQYEKWRKS